MTTIIEHETAQHISGITVVPLQLDLKGDDGTRVAWQANNDISVTLKRGQSRGNDLADCDTDGVVLVRLDVDGGQFDEVHTEASPGYDYLEVVERAIASLSLVRDGIQAAARS